MSDPQRFQQVEAIFDAAADRPPDERSALLDRACAGDVELRMEVESLLACAPAAALQLREIVGREASHAVEGPLQVERRIGSYRLLREIGRGGMGAVYLAVRDDDQYRTDVAIKLLHHGIESPHAVARFRDERQILATLEHPGIVRLIDGGSTGEGLPYLVMELVEGAPITRWADARDLGVRARVALFRQVCAAVAYAHQKLVVHRDLKPSNVLVTPEGAPKLLDFGIAKLLDPTSEVGREAQTRTGMQLLTPEYASPEQVRGEPASTSTDVYSLGAVLYELLTGVPALGLAGEGLEAMRAVLEVEPRRPSAVAHAARQRAIAGDLDNIVLKALHKDPARRYASVEQFSDDLGRHLDGQPVLARAATLGYRTGKLLWRNRGLLAALAVVLASLVTATAVSVQQARRADEQARRAQSRFDDVRRLANAMLFEVDGKLQGLEGATEAREVLVSRALEYLDGLAGEAGDDPALSRELAAGYMKIGDIQGNAIIATLGRPEDGLASYAKARQILDRLVASGHDDAATRWALARALYGVGALQMQAEDRALARASLLEATRIAEAMPRDAGFDYPTVVLGYSLLVSVEVDEAELAEAGRLAQACLAVATQWSDADHSQDARYWVGISHEARAMVLGLAGEPDAAEQENAEAAAIFTDLVAESSQNSAFRRELWFTLFRSAAHLSGAGDARLWSPSLGDAAGAEARLREALVQTERVAERDPKDRRAALELAATLDRLAATIAERDPAASLPIFERARDLFATLPAEFRESYYSSQFEWFGDSAMAISLATLGRREEALAALARGLSAGAHEGDVDRGSFEQRMIPWRRRYLAARVHQTLGDTATSAELLEETAAGLQQLMTAFPAVIQPYIGLVETLELLASIGPERRCERLDQAALVWQSWAGAPTSFTRRRLAELDAAREACRTGR